MSDEERYETLKSQLQEMEHEADAEEQDEPDSEEVDKVAEEFNQLAEKLGKPGVQVAHED